MVVRNSPFLLVIVFCTLAMTLHSGECLAQQDSVNQKRLRTVIITAAVGVPLTYAGLYQLWYKNSPHQSFTFFNDNGEWKQIDKAGHCIAYGALAWLSYRAICYASIPYTARHATVLAIALASLFGGFCEFIQLYLPWRTASMLDLLANVVGAASAATLQSYLEKIPQR